MSSQRRAGTVVLALGATLALGAAGSGALATPPLRSWDVLDAWYVEQGPAVATVALLRVAAVIAGGWLVLVGALQLVAPLVAVDALSAVVDAISPRFLRTITRGAAGFTVTAGLALPAVPPGAMDDPPGTAVMVPLDEPALAPSTTPPPPSTTTSREPAPTTTLPTTTTTTTPSTTTTTTTAPTTPRAEPAAAAPSPTASPTVRPDEVVVAPGDSFWSIAVDEAGTGDLVGYWRALMEANRDRLVDPANPDLLFPGQVLRLP